MSSIVTAAANCEVSRLRGLMVDVYCIQCHP